MIMIDMDMPDNCDECRFNTKYGFCKAMPDNFCGNTDDRKRPEWCPLKEQEAKIERLKRPDCEHANHDGAGCLGYCGCEQDDEPIDACKQCEKYTGNICAEY